MLRWEEIESKPQGDHDLYPARLARASVPGGWLIYTWEKGGGQGNITFLPDPNHTWDGSSTQ